MPTWITHRTQRHGLGSRTIAAEPVPPLIVPALCKSPDFPRKWLKHSWDYLKILSELHKLHTGARSSLFLTLEACSGHLLHAVPEIDPSSDICNPWFKWECQPLHLHWTDGRAGAQVLSYVPTCWGRVGIDHRNSWSLTQTHL